MVAMTSMNCGECGIEFAVPDHFYEECRKRGPEKTWYCPNGHPRVFSESDVDKMRRERDRAVQDQARLRDELAAAERAKTRAQAEARRVKKRAAAALCPCCNRHFSNVERHMKTKHPDVIALPTKTA